MTSQDVKTLRSRYAGTIKPGITGAASGEYIRRMQQLLREWDPRGASARDVTAVLGEPTERAPNALAYVFDDGYGGAKFTFVIEKGIVTSVDITGLE